MISVGDGSESDGKSLRTESLKSEENVKSIVRTIIITR